MKVIVYATKECQYYSALQDSCKKFNYDLITLGLGTKWNGMGDKILGVYDYLQKLENKEEVVLVVDAYDVIMCRDSKDIIEEFNKLEEDKVVFNAESLSSSFIKQYEWEKNYSKKKFFTTRYNKLNAGAMIGKAINIIKLFIKIIDKEKLRTLKIKSDQKAIYNMIEKGIITMGEITIDNQCKIFTAVSELTNDIVIKDNKLFNKNTKTFPFVIHGPGTFTSLDRIIKDIDIKSNFNKSKIKYKFFYYFSNLFDLFMLLVLIFAIFLIYKLTIYYRSKSKLETF